VKISLLLGLLLAASVAVAANDTSVGEEKESSFYETATVRARPVSAATASVTVMDRETIESLDVASVAELMRFVPGVDVAGTGPRAGSATAQIRGGDPNYTYILIDGVPLNDITDQVGGAVNLSSLSTAHVERIEVVRGPLSSFFGSTGLAGAINIITRRGESDAHELSFDVSGGDDSVLLGSVGMSQGSDDKDYFIGAFWQQQEDAIDAFDARDDYEQLGVQGNTRLQLGQESEMRLTGRYATWDTDDYPEASGGPRLGDGEIRRSEHDEVSAGMQLSIGPSERRHKIHTTVYRHELKRESPFIFNPQDPFSSVPDSIEDTTFTTWQIGWTAPQLELGSGRLNIGVDARLEDGESNSVFPGVPLDVSYDIDRTSGGLFAEYLIERGRIVYELGARVDVPEGFDTEVNPRFGVAYRLPNDATRLRASAGRAFKLPSFFALAVPVFGNPDLGPETVLGVDAGVEHTFASADLTIEVGVFFNRFEDLVDFDGTLFTHVNVPEVDSRGEELSIRWLAGERLFIQANATHQDFDDNAANDPVTHRPEWVGAAQVTWKIGRRTRWNVDGQWVSEVFDFQVPVVTDTTPGYQLYGTTVTVEVGQNWDVHARVDNLADKEYEPFIGFPGPDRGFRVGLRYRSTQ